jgi:hypothetical protein
MLVGSLEIKLYPVLLTSALEEREKLDSHLVAPVLRRYGLAGLRTEI